MTPPAVPVLRAALLVAGKDLRLEARTRGAWQGVALFAALAVLLFSFALGVDAETLRRSAPGLLWLAVTLASLLAVASTFAGEQELGTLEGLMLHPVAREALLLGKVIASFVLMAVVSVVALVLMVVLYSMPAPAQLPALLGTLVAAPAGLALVLSLLGGVSADLRAREALVPMVLLPIVVPVLLAATQVTTSAFFGGGAGRWFVLLLAFDLMIAIVTFAVFPYVMER